MLNSLADNLTLCLPKTEISVFQRPTLACQRRRFPSLCRNVCFSHPHVTNYICSHCMMCYTVRKKKCSPLLWYKAIIVWFSQFSMTVIQNEATLNKKRWPGTGSSPKTAVKVLMTCFLNISLNDQLMLAYSITKKLLPFAGKL